MPINPLIAMGGRVPDLGQAVNNGLMTAQNINQMRENDQMAPFRKQQAMTEADMAQLKSNAIVAGQILGPLESGDNEGARSILTQRRDQHKKLGLNTDPFDQGLVMLDQDPEMLKQVANRTIQLAGMFGGGGTADPAAIREYNFYNNLDEEGQKRFLNVKRAGFGAGGVQYSASGDQIIPTDKIAADKGAISAASERGKILARESTDTGKADLASKQAEAKQEEAKVVDRDRTLRAEITRAQDVKSLVDRAKGNKSLKNYYGAVAGRTPPVQQATLDLQADIERVVSLAAMAGRGELKGQGSVSDFEGKMLANAQTVLANRLISPERAIEEMERVSDLMQDIMNRGSKAAGDKIATPKTDADFNALPSGAIYIDPDDGQQYRKP